MNEELTKYPQTYNESQKEKPLDPFNPDIIIDSRGDLVMLWSPDWALKWRTKPGSTIVSSEPTGASGTGIAAPEALQSGYIKEDLRVGDHIILKGTTGEVIIGTVGEIGSFVLFSNEGIFGIKDNLYRFAFNLAPAKQIYSDLWLYPGSFFVGSGTSYVFWSEVEKVLRIAGSLQVSGEIAAGVTLKTFTGENRSVGGVAGSYSSSYEMIRDVVNQKIDTAARLILRDFSFDNTNFFHGGIKAGDITWSPSTGHYSGGSGVVLYRKGILGANASNPPGEQITFALDATTGDLILRGTIYAKSGAIGGWSIEPLKLRSFNNLIELSGGDPSNPPHIKALYDSSNYVQLTGEAGVPRLDVYKSGIIRITIRVDQIDAYLSIYNSSGSLCGSIYGGVMAGGPALTIETNYIFQRASSGFQQAALSIGRGTQLVSMFYHNQSGGTFERGSLILQSDTLNFPNAQTVLNSNSTILYGSGTHTTRGHFSPYSGYDNMLNLGSSSLRWASVFTVNVRTSNIRSMDGTLVATISSTLADFYKPIGLYVKAEPAPDGAAKGWMYYNATYDEVWVFFPTGWKALATKT